MAKAETTAGRSRSRGAGCGCKLPPDFLRGALAGLTGTGLPADVLVGATTFDDGAVYRLDDERAIVASVDFFTPVVPDPEVFGAIAATNALSDLYAMGASPLFALAVAAFPRSEGPEALARILQSGAATAAGLGCPVIGGHSIDDPEVKYGLAAIGLAHPEKLMRNDSGNPGDQLILTKPIGTGIAVAGGTEPALGAAIESMRRPNAAAARIALTHQLCCATDVTGFGLAGHTHELAAASGLAAHLDAAAIPLLPGVEDLARDGHETGGGQRNAVALRGDLFAELLDPTTRRLVVDPQTSGGLLLAARPSQSAHIAQELLDAGHTARIVGRLEEGAPGRVTVT